MSDSDFYDVDELEKIAVNLFHGWGYNFYRLENQLRADDLTVRAKVGWLLGLARASVDDGGKRLPAGASSGADAGETSPRSPTPLRARRCWSGCRKRSERSRGKFARSPFPKTIE